jgi:hypothetical protein
VTDAFDEMSTVIVKVNLKTAPVTTRVMEAEVEIKVEQTFRQTGQ